MLSSAPLTTFTTRRPLAAQHQWLSSDVRGRDRVVAGSRIIHVSGGSGFVHEHVLRTDEQRTEYPKASVAGLRIGASTDTSNRDIVNNYAAYPKNSVISSFSSRDGKERERDEEPPNQNEKIFVNDRLLRKSIGSYDSTVNTFPSDNSTSSNASTKPTQSPRTQGYSRTSRHSQNGALPPGDSRPDPNSRSLLAPGHGHYSLSPLDLPRTSFSCQGRDQGYYADTEAYCKVLRTLVCGWHRRI